MQGRPRKDGKVSREKSCAMCGKSRSINAFYNSVLPAHKDGRLPVCKKCCVEESLDETGENIDFRKFDTVLQHCDKPFIKEIWQMSEKQSYKQYGNKTGAQRIKNIIGFYFKNCNTLHQYVYKKYADSDFWDDKAPESKAPEQSAAPERSDNREGVYLDDTEGYIAGLEYCNNTLRNCLRYLFRYLCGEYGIDTDDEKRLLGDYVAWRIGQEGGIAKNDIEAYTNSKSSADNILIALKALRGTPADEAFIDAISSDLDTEGADDE